MQFPTLPWWRTDDYSLTGHGDGLDLADGSLWGPEGPALVPYFPDTGKTGTGWGQDKFMASYRAQAFNPRRILSGVSKGYHDFAFVMRGARVLCIDIDGKNGGLEFASRLGFMPPTTAEVSMSGNGYHLFYLVDDEWDEHLGFAKYRDLIGVVTGVDIRATGCVYHKKTQRWNSRPLAMLPDHIDKLLLEKQRKREAAAATITKTLQLDPLEILIMHNELLNELAKPIQKGKRNQTLFAIGSQLMLAEYEDWPTAVRDRASEVGIDDDEVDKLVDNITKYGEK